MQQDTNLEHIRSHLHLYEYYEKKYATTDPGCMIRRAAARIDTFNEQFEELLENLKKKHGVEIVSDKDKKATGFTPLHIAIKYSNIQAFRILLQHGANWSIVDNQGRSILDYLNSCPETPNKISDEMLGILVTSVYKKYPCIVANSSQKGDITSKIKQSIEQAIEHDDQASIKILEHYKLYELHDYNDTVFTLTPERKYTLGCFYEARSKNKNDSTDYELAVKLYTLAAEEGYAIAQNKVGCLYKIGFLNVPANNTWAMLWFSRAMKQGHEEAKILQIWPLQHIKLTLESN